MAKGGNILYGPGEKSNFNGFSDSQEGGLVKVSSGKRSVLRGKYKTEQGRGLGVDVENGCVSGKGQWTGGGRGVLGWP